MTGPSPTPRRAAVAVILAVAAGASAPASAQPALGGGAASAPTTRATDAEVARRLAFIEERLERGTRSAALWWNGWYTGFVVLTVGQAAPAFAVKDRGLRNDLAVGAVSSSLGVVPLGLFDFPPRYAAAALRALPQGSPEERRRKLARAERLLAASAKVEAFGRSWLAHAAGGAVAIASCFVHVGYHRVAAGIATLAGGVAINEAHIFTQPTAAIDDWRAYEQGAFRAAGGASRGPGMVWSMVGQPGGVGLAVAF